MKHILWVFVFLSPLTACGPTPQQQAFSAQVEAQCRAGDTVACHQRDGDPIEVARLEAACDNRNLQACQAVANYRVQQQRIRSQQTAALQANINAMNAHPTPQYPVYQAPQVQPVGLSRSGQHYYCNQLGSYVTTCR